MRQILVSVATLLLGLHFVVMVQAQANNQAANRAMQHALRQQRDWMKQQLPANSVLYQFYYPGQVAAPVGVSKKRLPAIGIAEYENRPVSWAPPTYSGEGLSPFSRQAQLNAFQAEMLKGTPKPMLISTNQPVAGMSAFSSRQ